MFIGLGITLSCRGGGYNLPLDTTAANASFAWGARKLRSAYSGQWIRVRRGSDNAEQNIGFIGGAADTAALLSFCGAADGFVTTLYDQSVNAANAVQATALNQPKIVSAGALITRNGSPSILFVKASEQSFVSSVNHAAYPIHGISVCAFTGTNGGATLKVGNSNNGIAVGQGNDNIDQIGTKLTYLKESAGWVTTSASLTVNSLNILGFNETGSNLTPYLNGAVLTPTSGAGITAFTPGIGVFIGGYADFGGTKRYSDAYISEIITFNSTLSAADRNNITYNQGNFYRIAVT